MTAIGPRMPARKTHVRGFSRSGGATCVGAWLVADGSAESGVAGTAETREGKSQSEDEDTTASGAKATVSGGEGVPGGG